MRSRLLLILQIVIPVLSLSILAVYAGFQFISDYCNDTVPDTTSIYIYVVDRVFDELNRNYAGARGIVPEDETALITYDDIPEISTWDGVKDIYVFSDADFSRFEDRVIEDGTVKAGIPADAVRYYGGCSGMGSVFGSNIPEQMPENSDGYVVYEYYADRKNSPPVIVADEPDILLYYKYDPSTWDMFLEDLNDYIIREDAISDAEMLITVDGNSKELQQRLMKEYPASNYSSAEFTKTWKDEHNRQLSVRILTAAVSVVLITAAAEVLFGILRKKAAPSKNES